MLFKQERLTQLKKLTKHLAFKEQLEVEIPSKHLLFLSVHIHQMDKRVHTNFFSLFFIALCLDQFACISTNLLCNTTIYPAGKHRLLRQSSPPKASGAQTKHSSKNLIVGSPGDYCHTLTTRPTP